MNALTKYRHVFLVGLQSNLVYRWNFVIRSFFSLFHLAVVFILWGAAYAGHPDRRLSIGPDVHLLRRPDRAAVLHRRLQRGLPDQRGDPQRPDQPVSAQADQLLPLPLQRFSFRARRLGRARLRAPAGDLSPDPAPPHVPRRRLAPPARRARDRAGRHDPVHPRLLLRAARVLVPGDPGLRHPLLWPSRRCSAARSSRSTCCRPRSSSAAQFLPFFYHDVFSRRDPHRPPQDSAPPCRAWRAGRLGRLSSSSPASSG